MKRETVSGTMEVHSTMTWMITRENLIVMSDRDIFKFCV